MYLAGPWCPRRGRIPIARKSTVVTNQVYQCTINYGQHLSWYEIFDHLLVVIKRFTADRSVRSVLDSFGYVDRSLGPLDSLHLFVFLGQNLFQALDQFVAIGFRALDIGNKQS